VIFGPWTLTLWSWTFVSAVTWSNISELGERPVSNWRRKCTVRDSDCSHFRLCSSQIRQHVVEKCENSKTILYVMTNFQRDLRMWIFVQWATKSIKELSYFWVEFSQSSGVPLFNALFVSYLWEYCHLLPKTRFFGLHFCRRQKMDLTSTMVPSLAPKLPNWWNNAT